MMSDADLEASASTLTLALLLAAQGFFVFPVMPNSKLPALGAWQQRASRDPETIRKWWSHLDPVLEVTREKPYNVGILTSRFRDGHMVVLDVDMKGDGPSTIKELELLYDDDWTKTMMVRTPSGGFHLYFTSDTPLATTAKRVGKGLDTRGVDGFVVAPGSRIDGKAYETVREGIQPVPAWLAEAVGAPIPRKERTNVIALLDTPQNLDRAEAYLKDVAEGVAVGQRGSTAYRVACAVRELGVSELACRDLMVEHWNVKCDPPMDFEELSESVDHAYRYAREDIGSRVPDFDPVEAEAEATGGDFDVPVEKREVRKLTARSPRDIRPAFDTWPLIDGWLDQGKLAVVYGDSNVGKTFVVMSMCFAIATGRAWHDRRTERGVVLFFAAEAGSSAERRIEALKREHGLEDFDVLLVTDPISLLKASTDAQAMVELVREVEAERGRVVLIVVDTLAAVTVGANENSGEDMGPFIKHVQALHRATRAAVLIVHHSGKDKAKGARGWSGIRAAVDTEIEVGDGMVKATKQRDVEKSDGIGFELRSVVIGTRPDGRDVTSATVVLGVDRGPDFDAVELSPGEDLAMQCLVEAMGKDEAASFDAWVAVYLKRHPEGTRDQLRSLRSRMRKKLAIEEHEKLWRPA